MELLRLANISWRKSEIPQSWKHALIIPIHKTGKEPKNPESYRPISLLSCVGKVIEKMVNNRLTWILETGNKLSETQCGFRKLRSTEDLLVKLEHQIRSCLVNRKVTLTVFFDLKNAYDTVSHKHLLLKLVGAGVKGNMVSWIEEFLRDRSYQYLIGNSKSDIHPMTKGLPQGSVLSPTMFNVMMADIPHHEKIKIFEYADDMAIAVTADNLAEAVRLIQEGIRKLEDWVTRWKLHFNPSKCKAMCFTKKKIQDQLPVLRVQNEEIEWVKTFKYLGLLFDAPTLTWKEHIDDTCRQGLQRVNVMKAMAGLTWGAERELLLKVYLAYVIPKLTYGITAVSSAAGTRLDKLNKIQNAALRIALGARRTSPIAALQVEAHVTPLQNYIKELNCRYYYKISAQEDEHPMTQEILQDPEIENKLWTQGVFKLPFIKRAQGIMRWWNLPVNINFKLKRTARTPPWKRPRWKINTELVEPIRKEECTERAKVITQITIQERYENHMQIYTDGSIQDGSTSAAVWIPESGHQENWRLDEGNFLSIMAAELFAICKAVEWVGLNAEFIEKKDVVILTDSLSSLQTLEHWYKTNYQTAVNQMIGLTEILTDMNFSITLQWVPSHVGIEGNEKADELAKAAHHLQASTPCPLNKDDVKRMVNKAQTNYWQQQYDSIKEDLHIGDIKPTLGLWTWITTGSRAVDTATARLRIGHSELNANQHRFGQTDSPLCSTCQVPETSKHYLLECRRYAASRRKLTTSLHKEGIKEITVKTLLGGGDYDRAQLNTVSLNLGRFLIESGRMTGMPSV